MDTWINFYEQFFSDRNEAQSFVEKCEALLPGNNNHIAKIMMHQTQRLISISDDLPRIRAKRPALQLLFILVCAEHISKLHNNFNDEGQSRRYVHRFFKTFLSPTDKDTLEHSFIDISGRTPQTLELQKVVDLLYDVRCGVVHEGKYWRFNFHDGRTPIINADPNVEVHIQLIELRNIVVRSCIKAIKEKIES